MFSLTPPWVGFATLIYVSVLRQYGISTVIFYTYMHIYIFRYFHIYIFYTYMDMSTVVVYTYMDISTVVSQKNSENKLRAYRCACVCMCVCVCA